MQDQQQQQPDGGTVGSGTAAVLGALGPCPQCGTPLTAYRFPEAAVGGAQAAGGRAGGIYIECDAAPACSRGRWAVQGRVGGGCRRLATGRGECTGGQYCG